MNKCGHLPVLCVLLLAFHGVLCSELVRSKRALSKLKFHDEISNGDIFKSFWRNSKQRRSVTSMGNRQLATGQSKLLYECGDRTLTVVLKHADVDNIRIYGLHGDQYKYDGLKSFCGVSTKITNTEFRLLFNYDSCYVKQESTKRVLSLSWYGRNLDLTCPVSVTPPSMICKNKVMELTVFNGITDDMSVALNGEWAPLLYVATRCWTRELSNQRDLTFFVKHTDCGVTVGKSHFDLDLKLSDEMITLSCSYEQIPVLPAKNSWLSVTSKPPTGFPKKAIASQVVEEQAFPVEQPARNADSSPSLHRRSPSLPKLPSLPGSFNLAVNFPFSLPIPTRHADRGHLISKPVALTPEPTYAPIPDPTYSSFEFSSSVPNGQSDVSYEQAQEEIAAPVTEAPKSEYHYMQYPYKFEKPASTSSQTEPSPAPESQLSRGPVSSAALYQPYGSAQNFPEPNPLQVNPAFASLAQYIPPGYFLCSYDDQQPPIHPYMFQPSDPNQPLQYQKPDVAQLASAMPPMKGYPEQLTSAVASSPQDSDTPLFQPSPFQQYLYQSSYGRQSSTAPLSPTLPLIPLNLQPQTRPNPAFQDSRPFQSQYYQKPSQPLWSVQQPWSISHFPVRGLSEQSRPFMSTSSQPPELFQYQTGGNQYLDPYQRSVVYTPGTGTSSYSQYQPSPFLYSPLRPEISSDDVSTENMGSSPKRFFQPRSKAPVSSSWAPNKGKRPIASLPPPVHRPLWGKPEKHVAKLPRSQGSLVRYKQDTHVHPERPSEPRSQKPQNDTMPLHQFFGRASIPKDVYVPPHFRSTSQ